jgi:putative aminopeptidase FrvX
MMGEGAVIRTGDRSTTFDGPVCDMLYSLAYSRKIKARRALMDGGTCEATAFAREGFRSGGVCAPVRHYHNMQQAEGRLVPEMVAASDLEALVQLIEGLSNAFISTELPTESPVLNDYDLFLRKGREKLEPLALSEAFSSPRRTVRT